MRSKHVGGGGGGCGGGGGGGGGGAYKRCCSSAVSLGYTNASCCEKASKRMSVMTLPPFPVEPFTAPALILTRNMATFADAIVTQKLMPYTTARRATCSCFTARSRTRTGAVNNTRCVSRGESSVPRHVAAHMPQLSHLHAQLQPPHDPVPTCSRRQTALPPVATQLVVHLLPMQHRQPPRLEHHRRPPSPPTFFLFSRSTVLMHIPQAGV